MLQPDRIESTILGALSSQKRKNKQKQQKILKFCLKPRWYSHSQHDNCRRYHDFSFLSFYVFYFVQKRYYSFYYRYYNDKIGRCGKTKVQIEQILWLYFRKRLHRYYFLTLRSNFRDQMKHSSYCARGLITGFD